MRWFLIVALMLLLAGTPLPASGGEEGDNGVAAPTAEETQVLLEEAASCPAEGLRTIAELGGRLYPNPEWDLPLTVCMWMIGMGPGDEFQVHVICAPEDFSGARFVEALESKALGERGDRLSVLQRDLITAVDMEPVDGALRGTVSFRLPDLLEGQFDFTAQRVDGAWRVVEFQAPLDNLRTSRLEDGRWQCATPLSPAPAAHRILRGSEMEQAQCARDLEAWDQETLWHVLRLVKRAAPIYTALDERRIARSTWEVTPLEEVVAEIDRQVDGVSLFLDLPDVLQGALKVTLDLEDASASRILDLVTDPHDLVWFVDGDTVRVSTVRRYRRAGRDGLADALRTRRRVWSGKVALEELEGSLGTILDRFRELTGLEVEVDPRLLSPDRSTPVLETEIRHGGGGERAIGSALDVVARMAGLTWEIRGERIIFTHP